MTATAKRQAAFSREPVGLDADAIVDAALDLMDEQGLGGFTMRALGQRLGVSGPTIYWHVGSKTALLEAVVERVVLAPSRKPRSARSWDQALHEFFDVVRKRLVAHPNVMELIRSVHTRAFEHWTTEALACMKRAGFDDADAATFARLAVGHAIACAHFEANTRAAEFMEAVADDRPGRRFQVKREVLSADLDPNIALATSYDLDEHIALMVTIFIDGIRAQRTRRTRHRS